MEFKVDSVKPASKLRALKTIIDVVLFYNIIKLIKVH